MCISAKLLVGYGKFPRDVVVVRLNAHRLGGERGGFAALVNRPVAIVEHTRLLLAYTQTWLHIATTANSLTTVPEYHNQNYF